MTSNATIEVGSWMRVVNTNVNRTTPAAAIATARITTLAPVSGANPEVSRGDEREDQQGDDAADRGDRIQVEE